MQPVIIYSKAYTVMCETVHSWWIKLRLIQNWVRLDLILCIFLPIYLNAFRFSPILQAAAFLIEMVAIFRKCMIPYNLYGPFFAWKHLNSNCVSNVHKPREGRHGQIGACGPEQQISTKYSIHLLHWRSRKEEGKKITFFVHLHLLIHLYRQVNGITVFQQQPPHSPFLPPKSSCRWREAQPTLLLVSAKRTWFSW